jgi:hypothetical protein
MFIEIPLHESTTTRPHRGPLRRRECDESQELDCQIVRIRRLADVASFTIDYRLPAPGRIGGYHWTSHSGGFQQHARHSLTVRRQYYAIGIG